MVAAKVWLRRILVEGQVSVWVSEPTAKRVFRSPQVSPPFNTRFLEVLNAIFCSCKWVKRFRRTSLQTGWRIAFSPIRGTDLNYFLRSSRRHKHQRIHPAAGVSIPLLRCCTVSRIAGVLTADRKDKKQRLFRPFHTNLYRAISN